MAGDLSVGKGGIATLQVTSGGHVTNATARVGFASMSHGTVSVSGAGSLWQSTGGIELGSEVGTGEITVASGGKVESTTATIGELAGSHGAATVTDTGSIAVLSDKLEVGVLGSGELHVLSGGAVSAATAVVARDVGSTGTAEVTGAGSALSTTGAMYVGGSATAGGGAGRLDIAAGGSVTVGTQLKIWQNGFVTVNVGALNYSTLEMAGGVMTQAVIDSTGRSITGFGTLAGAVTGSGAITASGGTLTIGDPASAVGVNLTGTLSIAANAHAVLLDADRVALAMTTALAQGAQLSAANGYSLPAGRSLTGTDIATVHGAFTNGGTVNGPTAGGTQLSFTDAVDGAGLFTGNIQFDGAFSPGTGLATVSFAGNVSFGATSSLNIEIGGATTGLLDRIVVSGEAALNGTLDVDLVNGYHPALGDSLTVLTFVSRVGTFGGNSGTVLGGHLALAPQFTPNSLVLKALPAVPGDINLDGTVNIFDINAVSSNWNTAGPQGDANGDGTVNIFDVNVVSSNWGATNGGSTAVPEPSAALLAGLGVFVVLGLCQHRR